MGVIQKNLYVDGINLANYGVFVSGEAVYNAPQRDVELVSIPGRNGDYIIDHGRFQNIEITYPASMKDDTVAFATRIAEIRNILASKHSYVRIEDEYNPDEYREGTFVGGLEVTPACHNIAGEYELVFNCKPQRWLKSGETKSAVTSGDTITNPTLFESKPLIEFGGYGSMYVNGYEITLNSSAIGQVTLANATSMGSIKKQTFSTALLNNGDAISLGVSGIDYQVTFTKGSIRNISTASYSKSGALDADAALRYDVGSPILDINFSVGAGTLFSCVKGTNKTQSATITVNVTFSNSTTSSITFSISVAYDKNAETITLSFSSSTADTQIYEGWSYQLGAVTGVSSQSVLGNPLYIDCELGDCYKIENGEMVFLNSYVSMPNDLPVLSAGSNSITYDNTINSVKITPRWWQI